MDMSTLAVIALPLIVLLVLGAVALRNSITRKKKLRMDWEREKRKRLDDELHSRHAEWERAMRGSPARYHSKPEPTVMRSYPLPSYAKPSYTPAPAKPSETKSILSDAVDTYIIAEAIGSLIDIATDNDSGSSYSGDGGGFSGGGASGSWGDD